MRNRVIDIAPLTNAVGAELSGVDLRDRLSDQAYEEIRTALNAHGVIFFRNQHLEPEHHVAFAERFGRISVSRFLNGIDNYPMIAEVRKEADQTHNVGGGWHSDHSYSRTPALGSILVARDLPESGGDTLFAGMEAVCAALSEGLRETLRGLKAVHSNSHVFGPNRPAARAAIGGQMKDTDKAVQEAVHPVIIRHPETGREVLYVNPTYTVRFEGWTEAESAPLLAYLRQLATRPEFTCRFRWEEGSVAFWDNRATWHLAANDYHGTRRLMHRITIEGEALSPA